MTSSESPSVPSIVEIDVLLPISLEITSNGIVTKARASTQSDAEVREAMIPRFKVSALPITATLAEAKQAFRTHGYSRLPVYRENLDKIAGVLVRRELEPYLEGKPEAGFKLEELLRPPLFIAATSRLGTALKQMRAARSHLAFVINEHGGLEGIVTLEDLLEEIVGEISDEYDEEVTSQIQEIDGGYLLDGMLAVRDANRRLGLSLPESEKYMTIAGFLLAQARRLVGRGEVVKYEGALFTVENIEGRRILRVRYTPAPPHPLNNSSASPIKPPPSTTQSTSALNR